MNVTALPFELKLIPEAEYAKATKGDSHGGEFAPQHGTPYGLYRRALLSPSHLPCSPPPWGTLVGVDLAAGKIRWQVPLGSLQVLAPAIKDLPPGSPSLGGPIVTAGGLAFVAGTLDPFLRAFDLDSGKELWKAQLPASAHATPMTYEANGRQYVVIAAGGSAKITEEPQSDAIVAYALPDQDSPP